MRFVKNGRRPCDSPEIVGLRFQAAARAAGAEHVTAHSGRVGAGVGADEPGGATTDVMLAGNWKTSRMVALRTPRGGAVEPGAPSGADRESTTQPSGMCRKRSFCDTC